MITNKLKLVLRAYFSANSTPEPDDEAALHLLVLQALKTESLARHNLMNVTERWRTEFNNTIKNLADQSTPIFQLCKKPDLRQAQTT